MSSPEPARQSAQRVRKEAMAATFLADCEGTEALFVAEYKGIDVASMAQLRAQVRAAGGRVRVVKNTVAKRVVSQIPALAPLADSLSGQVLYGSGPSAPAVAKALKGFAKEHEELKVRAGAMDGTLIDAAGVGRLADLPPRDVMLAVLAGTLNAPIAKLARTLGEVPAKLARALASVRDSRGEGGA